jgi:hypothetical protein
VHLSQCALKSDRPRCTVRISIPPCGRSNPPAPATHSDQFGNLRSAEKSPGIPQVCDGYLHAETGKSRFSADSARQLALSLRSRFWNLRNLQEGGSNHLPWHEALQLLSRSPQTAAYLESSLLHRYLRVVARSWPVRDNQASIIELMR